MKRGALAFIALVLLLTFTLVIPVSAAEIPAEEITSVSPRYVDISVFTASIDINNNGKASSYAFVDTANSTYTIHLELTLQRYKNGYWTNVKTWSGDGTGELALDKSYYVTPGYYYRTAATATVRTSGGSYVEGVTIYSLDDYY